MKNTKEIILYPNDVTEDFYSAFLKLNKKSSQKDIVYLIKSFINDIVKKLNLFEINTFVFDKDRRVRAEFYFTNNNIKIYSNDINFKTLPDIINKIYHECYHYYQKYSSFNKSFDKTLNTKENNLNIIDDSIHNTKLVEKFDLDEFALYYMCNLETAARNVAEKACFRLLENLKQVVEDNKNLENYDFLNNLTNHLDVSFNKLKQNILKNQSYCKKFIQNYKVNKECFSKYIFDEILLDIKNKNYTKSVYIVVGKIFLITDETKLEIIKQLTLNTKDVKLIKEILNHPNIKFSKQEMVSILKTIQSDGNLEVYNLDEFLYLWNKKCIAELQSIIKNENNLEK